MPAPGGQPFPYGPPPAGMPHNMWPPAPGGWPTPNGQPYPQCAQFAHPPMYPAPAAAPAKPSRNVEAMASVVSAVVGVLWGLFGVVLFVGASGLAAVILAVIGNRRAVKGAPHGRLAMLGLLVGILEIVYLFV
jgi:hypothetical protein